MEVFLKILGIGELREDVSRLTRMVRNFRTEWRLEMATAREQLAATNARLDDFLADVGASLAILTTKAGQLDAEGQAELDLLNSKLAEADAGVGDADGSDTPAVPDEGPGPVQ